ncbi:hypothetical protein HJC23_003754 [Cyclotella cryptica]|uniref:Nudix hydrolase domain-containing protein n=1 Tax=Cyclotella cryptica TaxID=29204 RepID=A0ABD3QZR8_9STRA
MFQPGIPYHETGPFQSHRTFLPDDQYGVALDNLVKGCTDILLLSPDTTRLFLGKRCVQPQPDWWFLGGRIFPGETPVESCRRLLVRELGLDIASVERFRPVCCQAFAFAMREQEPKHHGTADVQFCFRVRLEDEEEMRKAVLDEKEYCDGKWVEPSEVLEGNYHPALRYAVACMLATEAYDRLEECEAKGGGDNDEEIVRLTREFIKKSREAKQVLERTDYKLDSKELDYATTVNTKF